MAHHIVVIDDDLALQEFYRLFLESERYKVTILPPFPFSLSSIDTLHVDLFILDLLIGGKQSGWSILQTLRNNPQSATIPVILVTAMPAETLEVGRKKFALPQNMPFILKPFDVDELLASIASLLPLTTPPLESSAYNDTSS